VTNRPGLSLYQFIVDRINIGILVIDRDYNIVLWNRFMETYSGHRSSEVIGKALFECFPDLPKRWLAKKLESVFLLKNYAFTSWQHRPYLFLMTHNRPITGGVESMRQDCTFLPVTSPDGTVEHVCMAIADVTENAIYDAKLREAIQEIEFLGAHDALTGLANRRTMEKQLSAEMSRATRYGSELSIVLFDIDRFKTINDSHGHLIGDEVLRSVAHRVKGVIRDTDAAARFGGDEFVLILPGTREEGAGILAERLRCAICEREIDIDDRVVTISITAGVTQLRSASQEATDLLSEADKALYHGKLAGRDRIVCFSSLSQEQQAGMEPDTNQPVDP